LESQSNVLGRVWTLAMEKFAPRIRILFMSCLRVGRFPSEWKKAALVFLQKEEKPEDSSSICLLDELNKLFQRIIAARITRHLSRISPNL